MSLALDQIAITEGPGLSPEGWFISSVSSALGNGFGARSAAIVTLTLVGASVFGTALVGPGGIGAKARFAGIEGETPLTFANRAS